uniref:Uncharacterized protein n=1 Tax=Arundo donax TaxID=35708 RepID=A0A0A9CZM2_ARUDO
MALAAGRWTCLSQWRITGNEILLCVGCSAR